MLFLVTTTTTNPWGAVDVIVTLGLGRCEGPPRVMVGGAGGARGAGPHGGGRGGGWSVGADAGVACWGSLIQDVVVCTSLVPKQTEKKKKIIKYCICKYIIMLYSTVELSG